MTDTAQVLLSTAPVIALFVVGFLLRKFHFIKQSSMEDLRTLVLYVALPALLFTVFLNLPLSSDLFTYFGIIFVACGVLTGVGVLLARAANLRSPFAPFMFVGFETGMLGYAVFIAAFGAGQAEKLASFDLGQLFYVWIVLIGPLLRLKTGTRSPSQIIFMFFKSPVVLGILAGLAANFLGQAAGRSVLLDTVESIAETASLITVPLISIIIGYSFTVHRSTLGQSLLTIMLRLPVILGLGFLIELLLLRGVLGLPLIYRRALVTMFLLPPPFVYPLFLRSGDQENAAYLSTTFSLHTAISIVLFILIVPLVGG